MLFTTEPALQPSEQISEKGPISEDTIWIYNKNMMVALQAQILPWDSYMKWN